MADIYRRILDRLVFVVALGFLTVAASAKTLTVAGRAIDVTVTFGEKDPSQFNGRAVSVLVTQPANTGGDVYFDYAFSDTSKDPATLSYARQYGWLGNSAASWSFNTGYRTGANSAYMYVRLSPATGTAQYMSFQIGVPEYTVKFRLPANNTSQTIVYFFVQDGEQVGSTVQAPGAAIREYTLGGLTSSNPVTVQQWTGGLANYMLDQSGNGAWVRSGSTVVSDRASQTPVEGANQPAVKDVSNAPGTGGIESGPNKTPTVGAVTAPTPTTAPVAPVATPAMAGPAAPVKPTPSGDGGASKADVEGVGNRIVDQLHANAVKSVEGVNSLVTATDNVAKAVNEGAVSAIGATDKVTAAVVATGNSTVQALNLSNEALDRVNANLEAMRRADAEGVVSVVTAVGTLGTKLDAANQQMTKLGAEVDRAALERTAAATAAASAVADSSASGSSAALAHKQAYGDAPPSSVSVAVSGSAPSFQIALPASMGGATYDFNPFTESRLGPVVSWFRTAVEWLVLVTLAVWVWQRIGEWSRGLSTLTPSKSNAVSAVPGTGIVGAAAVAAAVTAITVPFVTALVSWTFGDISLSFLTSISFSNPVANMPGNALWMLDQMFPVATIVTVAIARLSFAMYAAPLYAGVVAVTRWVVS